MVSATRLMQLIAIAITPMVALVAAQSEVGTVHAVESLAVTPTPTPTPAPTPYVPAPIPVATDDSTTFRKVATFDCSQDVAASVKSIYSKNRALFDTCASQTKYQIFPFSGTLPTPEQIQSMATTKSCTALFTACVLANLPQCDISGLGLKSVTESLLKVTVDVQQGKPAPDTKRFHEVHMWRRDVNLAQAAGLPFGNDSQLYAEFSTNLWTALTNSDVRVLPDLTIVYNLNDLNTNTTTGSATGPDSVFFNKTSGQLANVVDGSSSSGGGASVGSTKSAPGSAGRLASLVGIWTVVAAGVVAQLL